MIFCLAMMRRDSERSRRFSSAFCSFCLLQKCGGELQALAYHLYRRTQSGRRFGANEFHVLLASRGGGFWWVDLSFKFCYRGLPLLF